MLHCQFPLSEAEALIFLNGQRDDVTAVIAHLDAYQHLIVADGAWNDLHDTAVGERLTADHGATGTISAVIGDGDSIIEPPAGFIEAVNQHNTDFEKIMAYLLTAGVASADIYWGSGGEMDHFLGNLSVAAKYGHAIRLRFFDANHCYFYSAESCQIIGAKNKQLSIYPFPKALVSSQGLRYELDNKLLKQYEQQSLRNTIISQQADIRLRGNAFLFIQR